MTNEELTRLRRRTARRRARYQAEGYAFPELEALKRADAEAGTYGVTGITECGRTLDFLNTGDTYDATLGYDRTRGQFLVLPCGWGSWVEEQEARHFREEGEVRCGYCGAYTEPGKCHDDEGNEYVEPSPWDED